jgi:type III pantothenate kinase
MLLCLDTGNSQIHGGVFEGDRLCCQFRKSTHPLGSGDELGVFFTTVLAAQGIRPAEIDAVSICSVVPAALHALHSAAEKYFHVQPFVLQAGARTGLKVRYRNPHEVGADRIAAAIGARHLHPNRDLIVVDMGTATTIEVVTAEGEYLGGAILPGVGVSAEALASHTAKLPRIEIARPEAALGRTTTESIQSGIYHGHAGAMDRLIRHVSAEAFPSRKPLVVATGGFARMFADAGLFAEIHPELVLLGLRHAHLLNSNESK